MHLLLLCGNVLCALSMWNHNLTAKNQTSATLEASPSFAAWHKGDLGSAWELILTGSRITSPTGCRLSRTLPYTSKQQQVITHFLQQCERLERYALQYKKTLGQALLDNSLIFQSVFDNRHLYYVTDETEPCCICREDYTQGQLVWTLKCDPKEHSFHRICFEQWYKAQQKPAHSPNRTLLIERARLLQQTLDASLLTDELSEEILETMRNELEQLRENLSTETTRRISPTTIIFTCPLCRSAWEQHPNPATPKIAIEQKKR